VIRQIAQNAISPVGSPHGVTSPVGSANQHETYQVPILKAATRARTRPCGAATTSELLARYRVTGVAADSARF